MEDVNNREIVEFVSPRLLRKFSHHQMVRHA
jgi:hypothetical protein